MGSPGFKFRLITYLLYDHGQVNCFIPQFLLCIMGVTVIHISLGYCEDYLGSCLCLSFYHFHHPNIFVEYFKKSLNPCVLTSDISGRWGWYGRERR